MWSTTAFGGHGSPSPIIYNKLFNVLSAGLWEVLGDTRLAICLSFVLLTVLAFLGMATACRIMLGRRDLPIEIACGLLATYSIYATTDWLTRGAAAEYAAFALMPWLLAWCLLLVVRRVFSFWIGPLMALICLAHASIGLFCWLPVGIALISQGKPGEIKRSPPEPPAFWLGLATGAALLIPFALAALPYPRMVSFGLLAGITPSATHVDFLRLLWERSWVWGSFVPFFTVQIDPLLLLAAFAAAVLIILRADHRRAGIFLLGLVTAVLLLQTRQALFLYRIIPGGTWLQFSFRLLVFLVPASALCGGLVLDRVRDLAGGRAVWTATAALFIAMSLGKPWAGHAPAPAYTDADIAAAASDERNAQEPWEYYPYPIDLKLSMDAMLAVLQPAASTPCLGKPLDDMAIEHANARFAVSCPGGGIATLPITMAPGMSFEVAGARVPGFRICPDIHPHLRIGGDAVVDVQFPDMASALSTALRRTTSLCR